MPEPEVKAVLVRLNVRIFPNTRQDKAITDEVRLKKALGVGAGKWVKHLFPDEAFKAIREAGGEARRRHYDLTLPWEDGSRMLPVKGHDSYKDSMFAHTQVFNQHVKAFGDQYPQWVAQAELMHAKTFDASLYPDWEIMRGNFGFAIEYTPVPKASHFLTKDMASEAVEEMRAQLESLNRTRIDAAVRDIWNRLMTPVQALSEKLSSKDGIFRDSLIGNVTEILDLVPQLNLTNSADLQRAADQIKERFANLDPQTLRSDVNVRKQVAAEAKDLIAKFGQVGKRRFA